jgi:O-antigen ligase
MSPGGSRGSGRAAAGRSSPWDPAALAVAGLLFAGQLCFGANRTDLALIEAAAWFVALAIVALRPWGAAALAGARLTAPGIAFAAVLVLAGLSMGPLALGGVHPIWAWTGGAVRAGSLDPYATRLEMLKLAALAAVFLVGCAFGGDDERARRLIGAILLAGLAFSAWAFLDHVTSPDQLFGGARPFAPDRLSAAFGSANTAATLFGALSLLSLVDLARAYEGAGVGGRFHASQLQRLAPRLARPLVTLMLAATCLILTRSRAGIAATAGVAIVLLAVLTLARSRRGAISASLIGAGAVALGLVIASLALNVDQLQQRFLLFDADKAVRGQIFAAHWAAFQAAPWGGYGLGAFARINGMVLNGVNVVSLELIGAAHNVYIQWLEEAGAPGAAAMFAAVGLLALQLIGGARRRRRMRPWLLAILAVLALFLLHGASDYALETPSMAVFLSLLLGLGAGIAASVSGADPASAPARPRRAPTPRPAT